MKSIKWFFVIAIAITTQLKAGEEGEQDPGFTDEKLNVIEKNLIVALESQSPGIQASAAQTVRDLKKAAPDYPFSRLVFPLMRIVKDDDADIGPRFLAALALRELGSEMGDFAISRQVKFSNVERFRRLCTWLTYDRIMQENGKAAELEFASKGR